jgi:rhodanese-related sulfurtransferase
MKENNSVKATMNLVKSQNQFNLTQARSLVPLKDLNESYLSILLQDLQVDSLYAGQSMSVLAADPREHIYLLHGDLELTDVQGTKQNISGSSAFFPINYHLFQDLTLLAKTDCSMLHVNSEKLDQILTWSQVADYLQLIISRDRDLDEDIDWMMLVLRSNLFFKVPPLNVERIFSKLKPRVVVADEVIIRQGEVGTQCYFIKEGEADIYRYEGKEEQYLARIGTGRCVGEDALVNQTVRNATVKMRSDGVLMCLEKEDFDQLLEEPVVPNLTLNQLQGKLTEAAIFVDVRSSEEYNLGHLPNAVDLPLSIVPLKSRLLSRNELYIFYCDTGRRSRAAAHLLAQRGYYALALKGAHELLVQHKFTDTIPYILQHGRATCGID